MRLYWKILTWFWCALLLITVAIIWGARVYIQQSMPFSTRLPQAHVDAVVLAFEQGDTSRARELALELSSENRATIYVLDSNGEDILGRPIRPVVQSLLQDEPLRRHLIISQVRLPDGELYQVVTARPQTSNFLTSEPLQWISRVSAILVSFLMCLWLARYLAAPIEQLGMAARRLANGELGVRVGNLRGRRDEIADLAADFDTMAARIQDLVQGRQQLLRDISHELRSPLARLQVALALARRQGPEALDRIERDLLRLEELIGEVLALSRLDNSLDIHLDEQICLSDLVEDIVIDARLEAEQKPCQLRTAISPGITVTGNAELLHRAIENILRNAIKYTPPGSGVDLAVSMEKDSIRIQVRDEGPGVASEELESMFDPFVRLDSAREHRSGGYGLGLAIARRAIERHGGQVMASNGATGQCLSVDIRLPAPLGPQVETPRDANTGDGKPATPAVT